MLQSTGSPDNQIIFCSKPVQAITFSLNDAVRAPFKIQIILQANKTKRRLQHVIAVVPTSRDVQEQIDLGRGGNIVQNCHVCLGLPYPIVRAWLTGQSRPDAP